MTCRFVVLIVVSVPFTSRLPPTVKFLAIPTPPSTIRAPVEVEVDCVFNATSNTPSNLVYPSNSTSGSDVEPPV